MAEIIPAILPKNYEDLKNKISLVRGAAKLAQVDICDGVFVDNVTWPFLSKASENDKETFLSNNFDEHFLRILREQEGMPFWEDIDFELDLMVATADENFDIYAKLGPKRVIFHIEAVGDLESFKDFLEGIDLYMREVIQIGVAINTTTPVEQIFPLVPFLDFIQCMGIEKIGFQGQEFDERVLENIKVLKGKFPDIIISVDGGVNLKTAPLLIKAGAERLVAGSAIFDTDDIIDAVEKFEHL